MKAFVLLYIFQSNSDYNQIINMSSKTSDSAMMKYLAIGGGLVAAYCLTSYLAKQKPTSTKTISLETTLTLLKEVKYQVYASCIAFAEGVNAKLKANYPKKDLEVFLRTELAKSYEAKEDLILSKHGVSRDEYALALEKYKKERQVVADQAEILKVLEDSVKGEIDLTVAAAARTLFSREQLLEVYRAMCLEIGVKVWEKLLSSKNNNPLFDSKTDAHFKAAIRELGIYEFKVAYLSERGVKPEWGCPNLVFLKLLEGEKQKNPAFKLEAGYIEKGYEAIISKVSNDPEGYDRLAISRLMEDTIIQQRAKVAPPAARANQPQAQPQPVRQPAPQPPAPVQPRQVVAPPKPAQKPPQDDDDYMEQMMMQELLSRSQEEPKPEPLAQKVEVKPAEPEVEVKQVEPKVEEVRPVEVEQSAPIVESIDIEPVIKVEPEVVEAVPIEVIDAPEAPVEVKKPEVEKVEYRAPEQEHPVEPAVQHTEPQQQNEEQRPIEALNGELKPEQSSNEVVEQEHQEIQEPQPQAHHEVRLEAPVQAQPEVEVVQNPPQVPEEPQQQNEVQQDNQLPAQAGQ